jgi:hypothetical protein
MAKTVTHVSRLNCYLCVPTEPSCRPTLRSSRRQNLTSFTAWLPSCRCALARRG